MLRDSLRLKILELASINYPNVLNGKALCAQIMEADANLLTEAIDEELSETENIKAIISFLKKHITYLNRKGFIKIHGATAIHNQSRGLVTLANIALTEKGIDILQSDSIFYLFDSPNSLVDIDALLEILNENSDEIPQSTREKIMDNLKKYTGEGGKVVFSTLVRELIRAGMSGTI